MSTYRLRKLKLRRISLVESPANESARVVLFKSADFDKGDLDSAGRDDIADAKFAAVWTDADGNKQRKLPIHDAAHVRNALARFNQTDMPASVKAKARAKLDAAAKRLGIGQEKSMKKDDDDVQCSACDAMNDPNAKKCMKCGGSMSKASKSVDLDRIEDPEVRKSVEKALAELDAAQELLDKATKPEPQKEDIFKGMTPEAVALFKSLEKKADDAEKRAQFASEQVEKANDERIEKEYIAKAELLKNLSGKPEDLGKILKRVAQGKTTAADAEALETILKGANAAAKDLKKNLGASDPGGAKSAADEIDALVKGLIAKGDGKLTYDAGLAQVMTEHPELWERQVREDRRKSMHVAEESDSE